MIIKTVVALGPIIFLKLGENDVGQYDAYLAPTIGNDYLNYTHFVEKYSVNEYNVAPRIYFEGCDVSSSLPSSKNKKAIKDSIGTSINNAKVLYIDTAREAEIGLGTRWPYEPIPSGKCLVSREF